MLSECIEEKAVETITLERERKSLWREALFEANCDRVHMFFLPYDKRLQDFFFFRYFFFSRKDCFVWKISVRSRKSIV